MKSLFLVLACLPLWLQARAAAQPRALAPVPAAHAQALAKALNDILKPLEKEALVGAYIWDAVDQKPLYELNADRLMLPSSCEKVIPAMAAFAAVGPQAQLQTRILSPQPLPKEGTLKGPLVLSFAGDPELRTSHIKKLFSDLKAQGLNSWEGPLYLESPWSVRPFGDGWMMEDTCECYAPAVSPAFLDENKIVVRVDPAHVTKGRAEVSIQGPQVYKVKSQVHVKANASGLLTTKFQGGRLIVSGSVHPKSAIQTFSVPVSDPEIFIARSLKTLLYEVGIIHKGPILWKSTSKKEWFTLAYRDSASIQKISASALKDTINPKAEALFLAAATRHTKQPHSWEAAGKAVCELIKKHYNVDLSKAVINDGSGLSRYNLISPKQFVELLKAATLKPYFPEFKKSLAINAEKGTLRYRLGEPALRKRIYGKTGTMTGSCCVTCYLERSDGRRLIAFIGFSNYKKSATFYRGQQDACFRHLLTLPL